MMGKNSGIRFLCWGLLIISGGYYVLACAAASVFLTIWLIIQKKKSGLCLKINDVLLAAISISVFYFLTIIWAVDRGTALWGAVKNLAIPLFLISVMQIDASEREKIILDIPFAGAVMVILTFALKHVSILNSSLVVNGRFAGFFQYPNTFAMFLLIGIVILILVPDKFFDHISGLRFVKIITVFVMMILGAGLILSGSRAVLAVGVLALTVSIIYKVIVKDINRFSFVLCALVVCGAAIGILISILIASSASGHIMNGSGSTFWGRIVYAQDALKKVLVTPFGLGYLGYYFTQGSFQSAFYTVRWVHNGLLQLLLDIGWIPAILLVFAIVKSFISKEVQFYKKIIMAILLMHGAVDFDFEFVSICFILILMTDIDSYFRIKRFNKGLPFAFTCVLTGVASLGILYVGSAATMADLGFANVAEAMYPNTISESELLGDAATAEEMKYYADKIIKHNDNIAIAWDAMAEIAFSKGDFKTVIEAKHKSISLTPYYFNGYEDYRTKLEMGIMLYDRQNDSYSMNVLKQEEQWLENKRIEVLDNMNPLAVHMSSE